MVEIRSIGPSREGWQGRAAKSSRAGQGRAGHGGIASAQRTEWLSVLQCWLDMAGVLFVVGCSEKEFIYSQYSIAVANAALAPLTAGLPCPHSLP